MMVRRIATNLLASNTFGFVEIFSRLLNWVTLPIAGLLVRPDLFGQVVFLATAINILTAVGTFGQQRTLLHYNAADPYESYGALSVALIYAAIIVPVCFLGIIFFQRGASPLVAIVSFFTIFHALLSTQRRAFEDARNFAYLRITLSVSRFILVVGTLTFSENISYYIAAEGGAVILSLAIRFRLLKMTLSQPRNVSVDRIRKSGQIGLPILIQSILFMAILNYDKLLFGRMDMFDVLGQFGMLSLIAGSIAFITAFIGIKFEPNVYQAETLRQSYHVVRKYHRILVLTQVLGGVFISLVWFFAGPVLQPGNSLPWYILPLLFVGQILGQSTVPWSAFLTRAKAFKTQAISVAAAALTSVSLNTLLIPGFGALGASATLIAANAVYFLLIFFLARLMLRRQIARESLKNPHVSA